jgi:beta-galactosidase
VTVSIIDQADLTVPTAKSTLRFEISGSAEIVATDNGDATDQTSFQSLSGKPSTASRSSSYAPNRESQVRSPCA